MVEGRYITPQMERDSHRRHFFHQILSLVSLFGVVLRELL